MNDRANEEYWISQYKQRNALWIHDGNPKRPHALLRSGLHSNGFFNSRPLIEDLDLMRQVAKELADRLVGNGLSLVADSVDRVVGPQTGATLLAEYLADEIARRRGSSCYWASPAKREYDGQRTMVFDRDHHTVGGLENVLLCEDVVTTGGSSELTMLACLREGGLVLPYIACMVNRSGIANPAQLKVVALVDRKLPMWEVDECPLCKVGSQTLSAKDNWAALNAEY